MGGDFAEYFTADLSLLQLVDSPSESGECKARVQSMSGLEMIFG